MESTEHVVDLGTVIARAILTGEGPAPSCALEQISDLDRAYAIQDMVVPHLGNIIGYKVALGDRASQQRFAVHEPIYGVLTDRMLLPNGSDLPRGAAPLLFEADLLMTVRSDRINEARTISDVAAEAAEIAAFIEVPQLLPPPPNIAAGLYLVATAAGARFGIVGSTCATDEIDDLELRLAEMQVIMKAADGAVLTDARGTDLMGHPLTPALHLIEHLSERGSALRPGDRISLGTFGSGPFPAHAGTYTVAYAGLTEIPLSATVTFR